MYNDKKPGNRSFSLCLSSNHLKKQPTHLKQMASPFLLSYQHCLQLMMFWIPVSAAFTFLMHLAVLARRSAELFAGKCSPEERRGIDRCKFRYSCSSVEAWSHSSLQIQVTNACDENSTWNLSSMFIVHWHIHATPTSLQVQSTSCSTNKN